MEFNKSLLRDIGFDKIKDTLSNLSSFEDNKNSFKNLNPYTKINAIKESQKYSQEILDSFIRKDQTAINGCINIDNILHSLSIKGVLLEKESFQELKLIFISGQLLREQIKKKHFPLWNEIISNLYNFSSTLKKYDVIFDEEFNVKNTASSKLSKIRSELKKIDASMMTTANKVLHKAMANDWHMADRISWKNNRIVIPINQTYKRKVSGIIQDISQTGQTVFIEPQEIVSLNNRYSELLYSEKREVSRILIQLTTDLSKIKDSIFESYSIEKKYDYHFTIAKFAFDIKAIKPIVNEKNVIMLEEVINPLFVLNDKDYVPLNIGFDKNNLILITGPNAGGKTVVLKTLGLTCFMAQCGLFIPGKSINVPVLDCILSDIGDNQSIENDLSTFSSHISNINSFFKLANDKTLVLIDELGTGTDPEAGAAIAMALMQEFINLNSFIITTTHLGALKIWAEENNKITNAHMMFDMEELKPLYTLSIGKPGSSYAIEVLKSMGVSKAIINKCKSIMGKDDLKLEEILIKLQQDYKKQNDLNKKLKTKLSLIESKEIEIEIKEKSIDKAFKKAKHDASKEAEHIIKTSRSLIEKTIENIKTKSTDKSYIKKQREQVDNKLKTLEKHHYKEKIKEQKIIKLEKGINVFIPHMNSHGKVIEVSTNNKNCKVLIGSMKINLKKNQLYESHKKTKEKKPTTSSYTIETSNSYKIDLRGERVDSALDKVEKFLDSTIISGNSTVQILHGKGTGALIAGIHEYLKEQSLVKNFYFAAPEFGGTGITIVELK